MKRQLRRSFGRFGRRLSQVRSDVSNFVRSYSSTPYYPSSARVLSTVSPAVSDSDEEVFEATTPNESPTNDDRRTSVTLLPCEFCHVQRSSINLIHHQNICQQNPHRTRGRHLAPNITTTSRRRRARSDNIIPSPSAPIRTRSPSPTEGFTVPDNLVCPITRVIFHDPVVASDGHTYERQAITQWLQQGKASPMTRESLSLDKLNPNLFVKNMVDDFRAECRRKRSLYKYKLDVDVKKTEQIPYIKTNTKSIYRAEWMKQDSSCADTNINLMHLIRENAEKIAEFHCRLESHINILRVYGRVEHPDTGILLLQEYPSTQTLAQLMKNTGQHLSITHLDVIFYQIASALQHLANAEIIHGDITADNVFIYHLDEVPENTCVKLNSIGNIENEIHIDKIPPEVLSKDHYSHKSDVYTFGVLAQEIYSVELETKDTDLLERQALYERCLVADPNARPTFKELTKILNSLIHGEKCISKNSSSV